LAFDDLERKMPSPLKLSLAEIRRDAREEVRFLEETVARYPRWTWPKRLLEFAREFESLASQDQVELQRAHDFTLRLKAHVRHERLKGVEPFIWHAEALEDYVANEPKAT
jgi:hypothetical protein